MRPEESLAILTGGLVLVTAVLAAATIYYARQARLTVNEMRVGRSAAIRPRVVPAYESYGGPTGFPRVVNVGAGPALDVDVTVSFQPGNAYEYRWRVPILMPGDFREFTPNALTNVPTVIASYATMELHGTCQDAVGDTHIVDESFDVREWWQLASMAHERFERGRKSAVVKAIEGVASAIDPNHPPF